MPQPNTAKLKTRPEDYRLRNRNVGYLHCGDYRGTDSEGFHQIIVTCRPCGKVWMERARRVWMGHVTNCGCQGDDLHTVRTWLALTNPQRTRLESAQHTALSSLLDDPNVLDIGHARGYPDDWLIYWRFRHSVGLAPSSEYVLDSERLVWFHPEESLGLFCEVPCEQYAADADRLLWLVDIDV